jgi:putative DNA primase/helicase
MLENQKLLTNSQAATFDLRNFTASLNILKSESTQLVCECPVCGKHRLTINKKSGAYQCWSGGCATADIREALAPQPNRRHSTPHRQRVTRQISQKQEPPVPQSVDLVLAQLATSDIDTPQPQKDFDREHGEVFKTTYVYSQTPDGQLQRWVVRTDWSDPNKSLGRDKTFRQWHRDASGLAICKKGPSPWPPYRIDEFISALKAHPGIAAGLVQEGEGGVEKARAGGIASITFQGSAWSNDDLERSLGRIKLECPQAILVFLRDNDAVGEKKALCFQKACANVGIFSVVIDPVAIYPKLPDKGDIAEILAAMDYPEFIQRLEEEIHQAVNSRQQSESAEDSERADIPNGFDPDSEFTQKARRELYGDKPWICVSGILHYWTGKHYKPSPDVVESQRLWHYCNGYAAVDKKGDIRYPYASPNWVKKALEWVKIAYGVDPALIDPAGLNCTNGVLKLHWDGATPSWQLADHDPALYYTYEPVVTYNPEADSTYCDRLLEVLDAPQQEIFLRTIAASLDLATVREHKGRLVRALLLKGNGSNGKDTLRECVAAMYGYRGMTGATLTDFADYDRGRKFPLARLKNSRVNWASENANTNKLDKIESLKAFITGDPLSIEGKGKDEFEINPVGVGLFNVNETPNLQAFLEAIQSRYGILTFNKTFKIGADPNKGELEADPRFKYDPSFLRNDVLPAFLNRVLDALTQLMSSGIDYSCTRKALLNIQAENSHLFQFCLETGLGHDPNGICSAGEIWQRLEAWYLDNGTLTIEESSNGKKKSIWIDQARTSDANVKGANQVMARFQKLFPIAKRVTVGKGKMALSGISFFQLDGEPVEPNSEAVVSQLVSQKPLHHKDGEPVTPISLSNEEIEIKTQSFENCDCDQTYKDDQRGALTQLAHHQVIASNTANPTDNPTDSPTDQLAHPQSVEPTSAPQSVMSETAQVKEVEANKQEKAIAIPSPSELAAQILQCQLWVALVSALDAVAATVNKERAKVFEIALLYLSLEERQHLVRLLAAHIQQEPQDSDAYNWLPQSSHQLKLKALALASASGRNALSE